MMSSRRHLLLGMSAVILTRPALAQGSLLDQGRNLLGAGQSSGGGAGNPSPQQAESGLREALRLAGE